MLQHQSSVQVGLMCIAMSLMPGSVLMEDGVWTPGHVDPVRVHGVDARACTTQLSNRMRTCSIGKSASGNPLLVLEISDHAGKVEAKPNFKYIGNIHGDEPSGRWALLRLLG